MACMTRLDGLENLAAHWPDQPRGQDFPRLRRPDIGTVTEHLSLFPHANYPLRHIPGPKAYIATADIHGQGSTRLHKDMTNAVNLMPLSIPNGTSRGALWTIVALEDVTHLVTYLESIRNDLDISPDLNPILNQRVYIDEALRVRIREEAGIHLFQVQQDQGDTIFIPAGLPHQVKRHFYILSQMLTMVQ